jgi:exodeoxyribonuclease VII small subunit
MKPKGSDPDRGAAPDGRTFEQMMGRLEELVAHLERGDMPLEESIRAFEEGIRLVKQCTSVLGEAEQRIQRLTAEGAGLAETPPLEEEEDRGGDELPF